MLNGRLHRLTRVYTCQNATLLRLNFEPVDENLKFLTIFSAHHMLLSVALLMAPSVSGIFLPVHVSTRSKVMMELSCP